LALKPHPDHLPGAGAMTDSSAPHPARREAKLYSRLRAGRVRCGLCYRKCVIAEGERGYCRTRQNIGGVLYTLVYGDLSALESRPIEIKPFFHYWPGSTALTFSTWSCNFDCPWCQNHHLSRTPPGESDPSRSPQEILAIAEQGGDQGLCASFQEPTLLTEFALDLFELGRSRGLYACYVSNGYMTREALTLLARSGLDGLKIDLKGPPEVYRTRCADIDVDHVLRNARAARKLGIHVEIVNLVITGVNDDQASIEWIVDQHLKFLGQNVPLHFTRYHPAHRCSMPPTPVSALEDAVRTAKKKGARFAYVGNVAGHRLENTYCPQCESLAIARSGCEVASFRLDQGFRCSKCGTALPIVGGYVEGGVVRRPHG